MMKKGYKIKVYKEMKPMGYKEYLDILEKLQEQKDLIELQMEEYTEYYEDMVENKKEEAIEIAKEKFNMDLEDHHAEEIIDGFLNRDINIGEKEITKAIEEYKIRYNK